MEWVIKEDIRVFPWDSTNTIRDRIFAEKGSLVDIRKKGEQWEIVDWKEKLEALSDNIPLSDLIRSFPRDQSKLVLKKFLKKKWVDNLLDEDDWNRLFQYEADLKEMSWDTFVEKMKAEDVEDSRRIKEAKRFLNISKKLESTPSYPILGWKPGQHKIRYDIQESRTLGKIFHDCVLDSENWLLALWKNEETILSKMNRDNDPRILELLKDEEGRFQDLENGIYLFSTKTVPVFMYKKSDNLLILEVEFQQDEFLKDTFACLGIEKDHIQKKKDIGLVGQFVFPDSFLEFVLFQDCCLNDPILSQFLYVDESKRAHFEATLWISLTEYFRGVLGIEKQNSDMYLKNIHRQAGFLNSVVLTSPIPEEKIDLFLDILGRLMERFRQLQPELLEEYTRIYPNEIPAFFEKQKKGLIKNIKKERPNYFLKYPRMFVKNLYSVKCQKKFQPILITENDAEEILDSSRYIKFPLEKLGEFEPEYYYCPSEEAPYAGLKEMKGSKVGINFAPCCFKSPQDFLNEENLEKVKLLNVGEEEDEEEEEESGVGKKVKKDYVVKQNLLIKTPGQLGRINSKSMRRFLFAYDPFSEYFRVGIPQDENAMIHCMIYMKKGMGFEMNQTVEQIREEMAGNPEIIKACLQDNPGWTAKKIQETIADVSTYFDPRRFFEAVQIYFNVRLILFTKQVKEKDANLFRPLSMRSHVSNLAEPPYVMIYEHYGGKTNILTEIKHPHCELISFKAFGEDKYQFEFKSNMAMEVLDNLIFQFDGKHPVYPFSRFSARNVLDYLIGQTLDGLGKVRMLHFRYNGQVFTSTVAPPMPVQPSVPVVDPIHVESDALEALPFLFSFQKWQEIQIPDPSDTLVLWTVSEPAVFWKNIEKNTEIRLTFKIRLPRPRKEEIEDTLHSQPNLPIRISPDEGLKMQIETRDWLTPEIYNEKRARCLDRITRFLFSGFLLEHSIPNKAFDPDSILEKFQKLHVLIQDDQLEYTQMNNIQNFIHKDRIRIPSLRVWNKISFGLKWQMFYNFKELLEVGKQNPEEVFYQALSDFIFSDKTHYYCEFSQLKMVLEKSIEERYPLSTASLTKIEQNGLWYNGSESPFPYPCLVYKLPSLKKALKLATFYIQEGYIPEETPESSEIRLNFLHFNWDSESRKWVYKGGEGIQKVFTFVRENDCLLLFKD